MFGWFVCLSVTMVTGDLCCLRNRVYYLLFWSLSGSSAWGNYQLQVWDCLDMIDATKAGTAVQEVHVIRCNAFWVKGPGIWIIKALMSGTESHWCLCQILIFLKVSCDITLTSAPESSFHFTGFPLTSSSTNHAGSLSGHSTAPRKYL